MLFLSAVFNLYKMAIIRIKKKDNPFVQIDKGLLKDRELSLKAKGLLCCLLAFPDDWKISIADLKNRSKDGEHSVSTTINELIKAGYMTREKCRVGGKFKGYDYTVFEEKQNTVTGFSRYGESRNGKTPTTNNIGTNNIATTTKAIWSIEDIKSHIRTEYATDWNTLATMVEQQTFLAIPLDICREGLASFMTKCDAKAKITSHQDLNKELAEWIRKEYKFSKLAATKKKDKQTKPTCDYSHHKLETKCLVHQFDYNKYFELANQEIGTKTGALKGMYPEAYQNDLPLYESKLKELTELKNKDFSHHHNINELNLFELIYAQMPNPYQTKFRAYRMTAEDSKEETLRRFKIFLNDLGDYKSKFGNLRLLSKQAL